MAKYLGNLFVMLVGTASPPTEPAGACMDYDEDNPRETHDSTTNDDGDDDTHVTGHRSGTHTFKFYTDRANAGQNILRAADDAGSLIYFKYQPEGTGSTKPQHAFQGSVVLKPSEPMRGLAVTQCTIKRSGAIDKTAQA